MRSSKIAGAAVVFGTLFFAAQAKADTVNTFSISGITLTRFAPESGTLTIDATTGTLTQFNLVLGSPDGNTFFATNLDQANYADGFYNFTINDGGDVGRANIQTSDLSTFAGGRMIGAAYEGSSRRDDLSATLTLTGTTTVPEPGALSLVGLAGVGLLRRRRA